MHGETFVIPLNRQNIKFLEKLAFIISLFYLSSICAETKYNLFNCPDLEATLQCSSECKIYGTNTLSHKDEPRTTRGN